MYHLLRVLVLKRDLLAEIENRANFPFDTVVSSYLRVMNPSQTAASNFYKDRMIFFTRIRFLSVPIIQYQQAGIAQLVEYNLAKVGVASSNLVSRSIC